jgi:hypothetical protein
MDCSLGFIVNWRGAEETGCQELRKHDKKQLISILENHQVLPAG